jgi:hypothetical protein
MYLLRIAFVIDALGLTQSNNLAPSQLKESNYQIFLFPTAESHLLLNRTTLFRWSSCRIRKSLKDKSSTLDFRNTLSGLRHFVNVLDARICRPNFRGFKSITFCR